jgi:hypothetical protein
MEKEPKVTSRFNLLSDTPVVATVCLLISMPCFQTKVIAVEPTLDCLGNITTEEASQVVQANLEFYRTQAIGMGMPFILQSSAIGEAQGLGQCYERIDDNNVTPNDHVLVLLSNNPHRMEEDNGEYGGFIFSTNGMDAVLQGAFIIDTDNFVTINEGQANEMDQLPITWMHMAEHPELGSSLP